MSDLTTADIVAPAAGRYPNRQPKAVYLLFGVEMWERFSYYGMRAFLVLFLVSKSGGFGWSKEDAGILYGWYTGLVYLTPLLGGYLADRVLGTHRAVIVGSCLIASGHFCLAVPQKVTFFLGLCLIILGTGFHKANLTTMVGQLFELGDPRRDAAFTIYYMGVNTGGLLGPLVCGSLAENENFGWHWGFASAGVGMVLGTVLYVLLRRRYLGNIGEPPAGRHKTREARPAEHRPLTRAEKERIAAIAIMAFFQVLFFSAFEQAGSSMNFFAKERTDRTLFGWEIKTSYFQSINSFGILAFGPMFASLWVRLGARGREPATTIKFVWGLLLVAGGFGILTIAARISESGVLVSPLWLLTVYLLHTWGELSISPVGLSMVTKLAPPQIGSFMMGLWYTSLFLGNLSAGLLASQQEKIANGAVFHFFGGQADYFFIFFLGPLAGAIGLLIFSRKLDLLMHGRA